MFLVSSVDPMLKNILKLHIIYQKYDGILHMYDVAFRFIQKL